MIDKLRVRNFRCLRDVEVPLGPLNFLIGPNDTGKTSFLDAVQVLCGCVNTTSVDLVFAQRGNVTIGRGWDGRGHALNRTFSHGKSDADLEYRCRVLIPHTGQKGSEALYDLGIGKDETVFPAGQAIVRAEKAAVGDGMGVAYERDTGQPTKCYARRGDAGVSTLNLDLLSTIPVQVKDDADLRKLGLSLLSTPVHRLTPPRIAKPCPMWPGKAIDADGFGLGSYLATVDDLRPERFARIESALTGFVPRIDKVTFPSVSRDEKSILFHEKGGAKVYASEASDGLLVFLGYLTIAYAHEDVSIVLIEEPETGVHPHRLGDIVRVLRAMSRGELGLPSVQVIATSHSPHLLDCCEKEEIILFDRDKEGDVHAMPLAQVKDIDDRLKDFSPGELIFTMGKGICGSHS